VLVLRLEVAAQLTHTRPGAPLTRLVLPPIVAACLTAALLGGGCERRAAASSTVTATTEGTTTVRERFGDAPLLTLIDAGRGLAMTDGSTLPLSAATCGSCHIDIYREWQGATHAAALSDLQYLAEISKDATPRWLCLNCHIPLAEQREYLVDGEQRLRSTPWTVGELVKVDNPGFRGPLQREAVTCASCHVRAGPDGRGIVTGPRGSARAPHVVERDPEALRSVCLRCHSPGPIELTPTFFCWFESAEELAAGGSDQTCVDCHMPTTSRAIAAGAPVTETRRHTWWGSGVPKHFDGFGQQRARGYTPGVDVAVAITRPGTPAPGPDLKVIVTLNNARGGHKVPTADPERYLLVDVRTVDGKGETLARASAKIGQRWDFGDVEQRRPAKRLGDNRLAHGESRALAFVLPRDAGAQRVVVDVKHVRLSASNAGYAAKAPIDERIRHFRSNVDQTLPRLWEHYPLFAYIFHEAFELDSARAERMDGAQLERLSAEAASWSLERLLHELQPQTLIEAP
jgi:nitrate reductase cytochrome c-type subunit